MIATQQELDALVDRVAREPEIAVDCEMDAMYAYRTSLCVVQVGWRGGEALIDALVDLDRTGLARLFADASITKVFHGGENDIGLMAGHWDMRFANVFDTMAAAQVLGHEGVGLAAQLERHFGVQLSKRFQKADWRVRPLPDDQAEYARLDVRHLLPLRERLLDDLQRLRRVEEAGSEFSRIMRARFADKPFDPDAWVRVKGARELPVAARGMLCELFRVRDELAAELDRAPYRVLHESSLITICRARPTSAAALLALRGVNRHLAPEHVARLLEALRRGARVSELPLPSRRPPAPGERAGGGTFTPEQTALFDRLRAWRERRARKRGVHVARVATNALLAAIVRAAPADLESLGGVDGMEDWRVREYGAEMLGELRRRESDSQGA